MRPLFLLAFLILAAAPAVSQPRLSPQVSLVGGASSVEWHSGAQPPVLAPAVRYRSITPTRGLRVALQIPIGMLDAVLPFVEVAYWRGEWWDSDDPYREQLGSTDVSLGAHLLRYGFAETGRAHIGFGLRGTVRSRTEARFYSRTNAGDTQGREWVELDVTDAIQQTTLQLGLRVGTEGAHVGAALEWWMESGDGLFFFLPEQDLDESHLHLVLTLAL